MSKHPALLRPEPPDWVRHPMRPGWQRPLPELVQGP